MTRMTRLLLLLSNFFIGLAALSAVTSVIPFVIILKDYGWHVFRVDLGSDWWFVILVFFPGLFLTACTLLSGLGIRKFIEFADDLKAVRAKLESQGGCES